MAKKKTGGKDWERLGKGSNGSLGRSAPVTSEKFTVGEGSVFVAPNCRFLLACAGGLGIEIVQEFELPNDVTLCVSVGCVDRFNGDAIVNAANEGCYLHSRLWWNVVHIPQV